MSIPFPLNNDNTPQDTSSGASQASLPVKPFRTAATKIKPPTIDPKVLRALYNDNKELSRALLNGLVTVCIIAGSIIAKTGFTYATIGLMVLAVLGLAFVDTWNAVLLFLVYLSLEGMYKYTSNFNAAVYIMAPLMAITIFVAWAIKSRGEAERKQAKENSDDTPKPQYFVSNTREGGVRLPTAATWVFGLIALCFLQAMNPDSPGVVNSMNGAIVWYLGPMAFFFVSYFTLKRRRDAMAFVYTLLITGCIMSAYALIQFNMGQEWTNSHVPGIMNLDRLEYFSQEGSVIESGAFRPAATAAIAGGYVVFSSIALLSALTLSTLPKFVTWRRTLALLSITIMAMAILVSGVRLSVLSLVVVTTVLLSLVARRFEDVIRLYFFAFVLAGLLAISFVVADSAASGKLTKRYSSVFTADPISSYKKNRGGSLSLLPRAITAKPFGIGIRRGVRGSFVGSASQLYSEGSSALFDRETQYNALHLDLGVLGLICLAGFFATTLIQGYRVCRTLPDPNLRSIAALMYAIILFNFISTFGSPILQANYIFWSACGVLFALPRIATAERKVLAESMITNDTNRRTRSRSFL